MRGYLRARDRRQPDRRQGGTRKWQLVVDAGYEQGRRKQIFRSFSGTKAQAERALRDLLAEVERGEAVARKAPTFAEWQVRWLAQKAARGIRPRSLDSYGSLLRLHVVPVFGDVRLDRIETPAVQSLLDDLRRAGRKARGSVGEPLSGTTVRRIHQALSASLKAAVRARLIGRNPAADLELPKSTPRKARALDMDQAIAVVEAARGSRLELPILIAACTGLRRGEIFGLRWADVDPARLLLRVERQVHRKRVLGPPKSARGERSVPIPQVVLDAIERRRDSLDRLTAPEDYVFSEPDGRPCDPDTISTVWRRIVRDSKQGPLRLHDLRHSAGSILLAEGVPVPVVAAILGDDPATVMRVYAHALRGGVDVARDRMGDAFERASRRHRS